MSIDRIPPAGVRQAAESVLASLALAEGGYAVALVDHCLAGTSRFLPGGRGASPMRSNRNPMARWRASRWIASITSTTGA